MLINLQEPYATMYRKGYLRQGPTGRRLVDLYNSNQDRTTVAYARYLIEVSLGRILEEEFEVDHKDGDCSNDSLSNLQILTIDEHRQKTAVERTGQTFFSLVCAFCGINFERPAKQMHKRTKRTFCSRSCSAKFYRPYGSRPLSKTRTRMEVHGTYAQYKHGCKCQDCKKANTDYTRNLRNKKL